MGQFSNMRTKSTQKGTKKVNYNYSKLLGRITERFGTRKAFAEAMNIPPSMLSEILLNKRKLTQPLIKKMASPKYLDIPLNEYGEYFFTLEGSHF